MTDEREQARWPTKLSCPAPPAARTRTPNRHRRKLGADRALFALDQRLDDREADAGASWVVQGKTNPEIRIILGIQLTTVKKHLESTFAKLGVENRTGAVTLALEKISAAR